MKILKTDWEQYFKTKDEMMKYNVNIAREEYCKIAEGRL